MQIVKRVREEVRTPLLPRRSDTPTRKIDLIKICNSPALRPPRTQPDKVHAMRITSLDVVDVFVYVVILNLAVQFVPGVISESFATSLLTAIVLKLVLEGVLRLKKAVLSRLRAASGPLRRATSLVMLVLLLPGSKFVVLWLEDLVFGDAVSLGGFWSVTLLVVTLTLSRTLVRRLLGARDPAL